MITRVINILVKAFFFASKNRRIRPKVKGLVKVNLGAGLTVRAGWINIDGSLNALIYSWPKIIQKVLYSMSGAKQNYSFHEYHTILKNNYFICYNLVFGIPLVDNCADFIYCSHLLEHLTRQQGLNLIREIYRVLKKGGTVRIVVPDLNHAISLYCSGKKEEALNIFYCGLNCRNDFARHKCIYDFEVLRNSLRDVGFREITRCEYQQGRTPDIKYLDNRPESSLFVESVAKL